MTEKTLVVYYEKNSPPIELSFGYVKGDLERLLENDVVEVYNVYTQTNTGFRGRTVEYFKKQKISTKENTIYPAESFVADSQKAYKELGLDYKKDKAKKQKGNSKKKKLFSL